MRSFPPLSSEVTTVVDTFANQNEGSGTSVDILKFLEKLTYAIQNNNNIYANHHCVHLKKERSELLAECRRCDRNDEWNTGNELLKSSY